MSKPTSVTISIEEEAYSVFEAASEIVSKAGIRVSTGQLVQTMTGYRMQYGTRTTLRHALRWLEENPDFVTTEVYSHQPRSLRRRPSNQTCGAADRYGELAH
jgi:hypothetical protein